MKPAVQPPLISLNPFKAFCGILLLSVCIYVLNLSRFFVGFFADDTTYIMGALSLLQGHYVSLNHPLLPPITQFPPGYSLFLLPFVKLIAPHWDGLKIISILLTLGTTVCLWVLFKDSLSPWVRWAACALFALNPITQRFSATVLSEPLFTCLTLFCFYLFRKTLSKTFPRALPFVLGIMVGWVGIIRTVGLVLIPAMVSGWVYARRWRVLAQALPWMLLPEAFLAIHNIRKTGEATNHLQLLQRMLNYLAENGLGAWLDHLHRMSNLYFVYGLTGWVLPFDAQGIVINFCLLIGILSCLIAATYSFWMNKNIPRALTLSSGLYLLSTFLIYSIWMAIDSRYVFPVLPFIALAFAEGARQMTSALPRPKIALILLFIFWVSSYSYASIALIKGPITKEARTTNRFPEETYKWISEHLPASAILFDARPSTVYIYTGRRSIGALNALDIEDFRFRMLNSGVTHVLHQPLYSVSVRKTYSPNDANFKWIMNSPEAFPVLYENRQEHVTLYTVAASEAFQQAYALYLSAQQDIEGSRMNEAKIKLEQSLQRYPRLACAHNAYGALLIENGGTSQTAERHFREAIALRPAYPLALMNLALLYKNQGHLTKAVQSYKDALNAVEPSGEAPTLVPIIFQELRKLSSTPKREIRLTTY